MRAIRQMPQSGRWPPEFRRQGGRITGDSGGTHGERSARLGEAAGRVRATAAAAEPPSRPLRPSPVTRHSAAALTVALALLVVGCGSETPAKVVTTAGRDTPPSCPPADAGPDGQPRAMIDWVDFVQLDGRTYSWYGESNGSTVDAERVGPVHARVLCTIADVVTDPSFGTRDGDASFLPAGTELHTFGDARPALRLAAQVEGRWRVYEAMDVPRPRTGADLLDLGGGVTGVQVMDGDTATHVLARVDDPEDVRRLAAAVLAAPVLASPPDDMGSPVFVRFELADGSWLQRPWNREAGVLAQRIDAPPELTELLSP